jgi:hypothetical protein
MKQIQNKKKKEKTKKKQEISTAPQTSPSTIIVSLPPGYPTSVRLTIA